MPYIAQEDRGGFVELKRIPDSPGKLNYLLSSLCIAYLRERGQYEGQTVLTYGGINEVMGVLACVQAEFYRKQAAAYEDKKAIANGDLPWLS